MAIHHFTMSRDNMHATFTTLFLFLWRNVQISGKSCCLREQAQFLKARGVSFCIGVPRIAKSCFMQTRDDVMHLRMLQCNSNGNFHFLKILRHLSTLLLTSHGILYLTNSFEFQHPVQRLTICSCRNSRKRSKLNYALGTV